MKLMTITAAALGAFALAACTPAEDETAEDAAAVGAETSTTAAPTDGTMAPNGTTLVRLRSIAPARMASMVSFSSPSWRE